MTASDLVIVIVSYNVRDLLCQLLQRLHRQRVIVVDNASTDGSAAMVREQFPSVHLIANAENRGFAAACNQGIRASQEPFILILNPDTMIDQQAVETLLETMRQDSRIGACGPRFLWPDGTLQPSCRRFPTLPRVLLDELGLGKLFPKSRLLGDYRMSWWAHNQRREVDQLMGAAIMLRRAALNTVGLFDEQFFLYYEEVDLCLRLHRAGWKVLFVPEATATHHGGASAKQTLARTTMARYQSLFAFYRKHYPHWHRWILKPVIALAAALRLLTPRRRAFAPLLWKIWSL
ncbi:MAG: glycosyltransferase family 2 protein [Verrucomicrobiae bacterium]|nr:glycosyltransferase family 2 protein [Verrucomicrobiae bacterium]